MAVSDTLWLILFIFILGVFPLYIIVKLLGGRITLIKALVIKVAAVIITLLLSIAFGAVGPIIVAIALMALYIMAFRIGIIRAFLTWLLEGIVLAALIFTLNATGLVVVKWHGIVSAFSHLTNLL